MLWKWSAALGTLILVLLMWRCGSTLVQGRKLADAAVRQFHERMNSENYEEIYRDADEGFRGQNHEDSIRFLEAVHNKLGTAGTATQINVRVDTNTRGTFLTTQYSTTFAAGAATEMFTWIKNGGTLKLYGYHIQSNTLMLDERKPAAQNSEGVDLRND